jgi:hypothetical protein
MTQALIAHMLGVPLIGATEGALKLQTAGLIDYTQGRIRVLNRGDLEKRTCECYAVVNQEGVRQIATPPISGVEHLWILPGRWERDAPPPVVGG